MFSKCGYVNVTKYVLQKMSNSSLSDVFFQALNTPKLIFGWGSALGPAVGTCHSPQTLSWLGGACPSPSEFSVPRLSAPPTSPNKILATPMK